MVVTVMKFFKLFKRQCGYGDWISSAIMAISNVLEQCLSKINWLQIQNLKYKILAFLLRITNQTDKGNEPLERLCGGERTVENTLPSFH
jgi:hypothetical protein